MGCEESVRNPVRCLVQSPNLHRAGCSGYVGAGKLWHASHIELIIHSVDVGLAIPRYLADITCFRTGQGQTKNPREAGPYSCNTRRIFIVWLLLSSGGQHHCGPHVSKSSRN
eukprot:356120-Chlamydomonas_euryale.AAC.10